MTASTARWRNIMESYCDHSSLMERCSKVVMCLFSSSSDSELIICLLRLACRLLQVLAPLPIGFAVFMVHLATIPITGTGINPARSFGAQVIYNHNWHHHVSAQFSFSPANNCWSSGNPLLCIFRSAIPPALCMVSIYFFMSNLVDDDRYPKRNRYPWNS